MLQRRHSPEDTNAWRRVTSRSPTTFFKTKTPAQRLHGGILGPLFCTPSRSPEDNEPLMHGKRSASLKPAEVSIMSTGLWLSSESRSPHAEHDLCESPLSDSHGCMNDESDECTISLAGAPFIVERGFSLSTHFCAVTPWINSL